jgi:RimJ/RimL family protein N-acetyltransferase
MMVRMASRPPERLEAGVVVLRRPRVEDAAAIADAVADSLDHLRPWMPWATDEAATVEAQQQRLVRDVLPNWAADREYEFLILTPEEREIVGGCGLHRRVGPGGIEIGYWVHTAHTNRGYASAAAKALTGVALSLDGITRVEIRCDRANVASQAIPRRLGYVLDRPERRDVEAFGETGSTMVWVLSMPADGVR